MEFLDEDARPRFVLQSKTPDQSSSSSSAGGGTLSKPILAFSVTVSASLIVFSLFFVQSEPSKSLLLWLSLSLLLGPLAPPSLTAGDFRAGRGPALPAPAAPETPAPPPEKKPRRRPDDPAPAPATADLPRLVPAEKKQKEKEKDEVWEERDWTEDEIEVLKKQLAKNPAGKPGRWDSIAESFRGRHGVEAVIRKAKELGEKKSGGDADSYSEFLRRRRPADSRFLAEQATAAAVAADGESDDAEGSSCWSSGEDIALLNALKAFPKEAAMRWEKVAAAVPGKSKATCVKRVAELKKGFRESKKVESQEE